MPSDTIIISAESASTILRGLIPSASTKPNNFFISRSERVISDNFQVQRMKDFFSSLFFHIKPFSESYQTMIASEGVLKKVWDYPDEDIAWQDL